MKYKPFLGGRTRLLFYAGLNTKENCSTLNPLRLPMRQDIVSLTQRFVRIRSHVQNTKARDTILALALSRLKDHSIERFERNGVKSALVYNTKKRPKKFAVILNGHLDIIPGKDGQYIPRVRGNRLYGVGVMDMKANVACLMKAFTDVAAMVGYPLALQLTTDEEVGGFDGTKYQIEKGVRADFVLAGEPTNFDIVNEAKGILWLAISARGKTAHGAYPWRGENAIWKMNAFLNALKKRYPIPSTQHWVTTINLSSIETNNRTYNKIPDDCVAGLDIRFVPRDAKTILQNVRRVLPRGCTVEVLAHEPALCTPKTNLYVRALRAVTADIVKKPVVLRGANGSSDARHFMRFGGAGVEFGPIGDGIGSDHEWVSIPSLEKYAQVLKRFLLSLR